jgi:hypothetical protein
MLYRTFKGTDNNTRHTSTIPAGPIHPSIGPTALKISGVYRVAGFTIYTHTLPHKMTLPNNTTSACIRYIVSRARSTCFPVLWEFAGKVLPQGRPPHLRLMAPSVTRSYKGVKLSSVSTPDPHPLSTRCYLFLLFSRQSAQIELL